MVRLRAENCGATTDTMRHSLRFALAGLLLATAHMPAALATGKYEIRPNSYVYNIETDNNGSRLVLEVAQHLPPRLRMDRVPNQVLIYLAKTSSEEQALVTRSAVLIGICHCHSPIFSTAIITSSP